jgi:hypothetical protein
MREQHTERLFNTIAYGSREHGAGDEKWHHAASCQQAYGSKMLLLLLLLKRQHHAPCQQGPFVCIIATATVDK